MCSHSVCLYTVHPPVSLFGASLTVGKETIRLKKEAYRHWLAQVNPTIMSSVEEEDEDSGEDFPLFLAEVAKVIKLLVASC